MTRQLMDKCLLEATPSTPRWIHAGLCMWKAWSSREEDEARKKMLLTCLVWNEELGDSHEGPSQHSRQ